MHDWLYDRARASPDETGLVRADTREAWTFAELDDAVRRTAGRLAAVGVEPGDHLGMVLPPRAEAVLVVHAALRLGATLVPMGERLTARELGEQLDRADVTTLVCDVDTEPQTVEAAGSVPVVSIDKPQWTEVTCLPRVEPAAVRPAEWTREDVPLILFTSGTSGTPKAVVLTFWNVLSSAVSTGFRLGTDPDDRWLVPLSIHHMGGIGPVLKGPLYGTTVVIREGFDGGGVVDDIDRHDVTGVSLVPTMLRRMLDSRGTLSDSLRIVLLGGAPAPTSLLERCRNYSIPVFPTYGMTETASQIATASPSEAFDNLGTVGRPLMWTSVRVVDEDGGELPPGETGELVVSGPTVTPGYYGDAAATDDAFCPYGLKTGDVGYRDDAGRVFVLNRKDDRIITGGENVDPGEVVDVIRSHQDVEDAAVVGLPDAEWGEQVAALVVPANGSLSADTVAAHSRSHLAGFKVPRTIRIADQIPRTVSGTIKRDEVKEQLREQAGMDVPDAETGEPAPLTDSEGDEEGEATDRGDDETDGGDPGTEPPADTDIPDAEATADDEPAFEFDGPTGGGDDTDDSPADDDDTDDSRDDGEDTDELRDDDDESRDDGDERGDSTDEGELGESADDGGRLEEPADDGGRLEEPADGEDGPAESSDEDVSEDSETGGSDDAVASDTDESGVARDDELVSPDGEREDSVEEGSG